MTHGGPNWPDPLGGYFDAAGNLKPEFVERNSMLPMAEAMEVGRLTSNQIRRFFGHCRRLETRLKAGETWARVRADFLMLDSAAADAVGKSPKKIPENFHNFIMRNVAAVKNEKDFLQGFLPHFEALVGFSSGKLSKGT